MAIQNINKVLEKIKKLDIEDQEYISDILNKRIIESKRLAIAQSAKEIMHDYKTGKCKSGNINDLWNDLNA